MESERLYINNKLIELSTQTQQFARTLQVNDILSLDDRQTNFTKNIRIARTPSNVLAMDFLGVVGNSSNLPYQTNTVNYYIGNEAIIYNGRGVINETNDFYNLTIYDGNIDLYKAIENTTLGDLNLTGLTHTKDVATVVNTFTATTLPYKYILADYNGQATYTSTSGGTSATTINVDYLVPSVKVSYLWDNLFSTYGFTYSGSIFSSPDFTNLYLTYPKGTPTTGSTVTSFTSIAMTNTTIGFSFSYGGGFTALIPVFTSYTTDASISKVGNSFVANENMQIELSATFNITASNPTNTKLIRIFLNGANTGYNIESFYATGGSKTIKYTFNVNIGDNFIFGISSFNQTNHNLSGTFNNITIKKYSLGELNFTNALAGFTTKDFIYEVTQRFGLTPYKDKYTNNYVFKTLSEIVSTTGAIDWTDKFQNVVSEKYIYGDYAQKNLMQYKYNDDNATYNDGSILINNQNIADSKVIIKSKLYSPDLDLSNNIGWSSKIYKLWNKEIKDTTTINYKVLENRFYLMRSVDKALASGTTIGSQKLLIRQSITSAPVESFARLSYTDIIGIYYNDISKMLDKSKLLICNINLKYTDITNFDFTKLYYIEQLGSYYLVNKVLNFRIGEVTRVEMIRVELK